MVEGDAPHVLLTQAQRRHFEVVLAKLEGTLDEVDRLARQSTAPSPHPPLTDMANDLPADYGSRVAPVSDTVRRQAAELAARLGLVPQRGSRLRTVRALLHGETVRLQDSVSRALKGYGALDPRAPDVIDPAVSELIAHLGTMLRALDTQPNDLPGPSRTP